MHAHLGHALVVEAGAGSDRVDEGRAAAKGLAVEHGESPALAFGEGCLLAEPLCALVRGESGGGDGRPLCLESAALGGLQLGVQPRACVPERVLLLLLEGGDHLLRVGHLPRHREVRGKASEGARRGERAMKAREGERRRERRRPPPRAPWLRWRRWSADAWRRPCSRGRRGWPGGRGGRRRGSRAPRVRQGRAPPSLPSPARASGGARGASGRRGGRSASPVENR